MKRCVGDSYRPCVRVVPSNSSHSWAYRFAEASHPPTNMSVRKLAAEAVEMMMSEDWMLRHEWLVRLSVKRPGFVAVMMEVASPDCFLYGTCTSKFPTGGSIPIPDRQKRQLTIEEAFAMKRARKQ